MTQAQYCSLDDLKTRLGISDNDDDVTLDAIIDAVSGWIEKYCGRRFSVPTEDETHYITADGWDCIWPGDIVSVTTLATDATGNRTYAQAWAATDFDLLPANAALTDEPYTRIQTTPMGLYQFPTLTNSVRITGRWGWPVTPAPVNEACLLQCERVFKRRDAPFGVTGSSEMGQLMVIPRLDPDVQLLLNSFRSLRGRRV